MVQGLNELGARRRDVALQRDLPGQPAAGVDVARIIGVACWWVISDGGDSIQAVRK